MATLDQYNAMLAQLFPKYDMSFVQDNPLLALLLENGALKPKRLTGNPFKFAIVTRAPGRNTAVNGGWEPLLTENRPVSETGLAYAQRVIRTLSIDQLSLDQVDALKDDELKTLVTQKPQMSLEGFKRDYNQQWAMGAGSNDLGGFPTLNGDATFSPSDIVTEAGFYEFQPPALQTNTLHGKAASVADGWINQFEYSSGSSELERKMIKLRQTCNKQGMTEMGIRLILCDDASFLKFHHLNVGIARDNSGGRQKGGAVQMPFGRRHGIVWGNAVVYAEHDIITADFTTADAQDGVMYFIAPETFTAFTRNPEGNVLSFKKAMEDPNRDVINHRMKIDGGVCKWNRRADGVLCGSANA